MAEGPPERARANKEWGARFAHLLATMPHSHQLGVCAELGIPWHTHKRWMAADPEAGSDAAAYQSEVLAALAKMRAKDLDDMEVAIKVAEGSKASTILNMRKHRHESRFKRFYADEEPQRIEMSGPDGGPIRTADISDAEIDRRLAEIAANVAGGDE